MKGKALFILGVAVGYVLGSRAGREQYEKVKAQAKDVWESPAVQEKVAAAEAKIGDVVREQGAQVADKVSESVKGFASSAGSDDVQTPPESSTGSDDDKR